MSNISKERLRKLLERTLIDSDGSKWTDVDRQYYITQALATLPAIDDIADGKGDGEISGLKKIIYDLHEAFVEQFDLAQKFMALDFERPQTDWISVNSRFPKERDADRKGYVLAALRKDRQNGWLSGKGLAKWNRVSSQTHTHWIPLSEPPDDQSPAAIDEKMK